VSAPGRVGLVDVLQIVDIRTKIVSVSSLAIGTAYAVYATHTFSPLLFVAMLLATLLVDMGTTGFNSYYDFRTASTRWTPMSSNGRHWSSAASTRRWRCASRG